MISHLSLVNPDILQTAWKSLLIQLFADLSAVEVEILLDRHSSRKTPWIFSIQEHRMSWSPKQIEQKRETDKTQQIYVWDKRKKLNAFA